MVRLRPQVPNIDVEHDVETIGAVGRADQALLRNPGNGVGPPLFRCRIVTDFSSQRPPLKKRFQPGVQRPTE